ncbi:leucine-rich repeat domain-containing protein, partial [bacterium]|nr:leucine-rich repeat domain-containing protein [bacterium]
MSDTLRNVHAKAGPSLLRFVPGLVKIKGYTGTSGSVAGDLVASFLARTALVAWSRTEKAKNILNEQVKTSGKGFGHLEGAYNQENKIVDGVLVINKDYTWPELSDEQRAVLRKVVILAGVTSLEGSFWKCTGLTSLTFPAGLTTIGEYAFCRCTGLTSVTFP